MTKRPQLRIVAAALALALGAASCGDGATQVDSAGIEAVYAASEPLVAGGQLDFASLEGTDTVLWFWAPW